MAHRSSKRWRNRPTAEFREYAEKVQKEFEGMGSSRRCRSDVPRYTVETLPVWEDRELVVFLSGPYPEKHPVKVRNL